MPDPDLEIRGGADLEIRGGGKGHRDPQIGGESQRFLALWASVWSKNKRGAGPPGHSPGSATLLS